MVAGREVPKRRFAVFDAGWTGNDIGKVHALLRRVLLAALALLAAVQVAPAQTRRVLLLQSFGPRFAPWDAMAARLREELTKQSAGPIDLYEVSLQFGRQGQPRDDKPFVGYIGALFPTTHPDFLVPSGPPRARFFLKNRS